MKSKSASSSVVLMQASWMLTRRVEQVKSGPDWCHILVHCVGAVDARASNTLYPVLVFNVQSLDS